MTCGGDVRTSVVAGEMVPGTFTDALVANNIMCCCQNSRPYSHYRLDGTTITFRFNVIPCYCDRHLDISIMSPATNIRQHNSTHLQTSSIDDKWPMPRTYRISTEPRMTILSTGYANESLVNRFDLHNEYHDGRIMSFPVHVNYRQCITEKLGDAVLLNGKCRMH